MWKPLSCPAASRAGQRHKGIVVGLGKLAARSLADGVGSVASLIRLVLLCSSVAFVLLTCTSIKIETSRCCRCFFQIHLWFWFGLLGRGSLCLACSAPNWFKSVMARSNKHCNCSLSMRSWSRSLCIWSRSSRVWFRLTRRTLVPFLTQSHLNIWLQFVALWSPTKIFSDGKLKSGYQAGSEGWTLNICLCSFYLCSLFLLSSFGVSDFQINLKCSKDFNSRLHRKSRETPSFSRVLHYE